MSIEKIVAEFDEMLSLVEVHLGISERERLTKAFAKVREEGRKEEKKIAVHNINLILPLAKGYAHKHRVGSNARYISCVEDYLEDNLHQK